MRYRCGKCGTAQWRGFFPERTFHIRHVVFHGLALGVGAAVTRALFERRGYAIDGVWTGLAGLGVCLAIMLALYGVAVAVESAAVGNRRCRVCKSRRLRITTSRD